MAIKKYDKAIRNVCEIDWRRNDVPEDEKHGAIGLCICLAFIFDNVNPTLSEMSKYLDMTVEQIQIPFLRLARNGIFSDKYNCQNDPVLLGHESISSMTTKRAWCTLAGVASGFAGNLNSIAKQGDLL